MVREAWLTDSIEKLEAQPLAAYDAVSDLSVEGKGIPWDKQDPSEEALESISAEVMSLHCLRTCCETDTISCKWKLNPVIFIVLN